MGTTSLHVQGTLKDQYFCPLGVAKRYDLQRFWWWEDPRGNHAEGSLNYYLIDHRIPIAILLALAQPLTTFFVTNGYGALNRLIKGTVLYKI